MKVFVVTRYDWYDEYHETSHEYVDATFDSESKAKKYIEDEEKKNGKNTKRRGTSYEITEQEVN